MELSALSFSNAAELFDEKYVHDLEEFSQTEVRPSPSLMLGACNVALFTRSDLTEAQRFLNRAVATGSSSKTDLLRRKAQFTYVPREAEEARLAAANDGDYYAHRTATVILTWANLQHRHYTVARDQFVSVLNDAQPLQLSWWHRMMAHFGLGVIVFLQERDLQSAGKHLQMAQYIGAVLGLRPNRIPDLRTAQRRPMVNLWPRSYLDFFVESSGGRLDLARLKLERGREEGIVGGIRRAVLAATHSSPY